MKKEALLNYIEELKERSDGVLEACQRQLDKMKEKNPDTKIMTFTIGEHLYLVNKNLNLIINELEQIIKSEEN